MSQPALAVARSSLSVSGRSVRSSNTSHVTDILFPCLWWSLNGTASLPELWVSFQVSVLNVLFWPHVLRKTKYFLLVALQLLQSSVFTIPHSLPASERTLNPNCIDS